VNKLSNFWVNLKKPIICLAPMADVTDSAFRFIISKYSKSSKIVNFVTYTEFVSADGLVLAPEEGRKKLLKNLEYSEIERPIAAQLFTSRPEMMEKASRFVMELGFDGIDINMGCPDKNIQKQGAGAALIKDPKLAREIILATKRGVKGKIPVSIKTRLGYSKDELETWLPELLVENPEAVIIHARTKKEMSKVPAKWERIKKAVEIRNETEQKTLIIGNGDVQDIADAKQKCAETGADGVMLGRAIFGNPWLFADYEPTLKERLEVLVEHTKLFEEKFSGIKSFDIMKKHFREYLKGPELRDLRFKLMRAKNSKEVEELIFNFGN
jgi:nifR3 family TIM-barrel protein